MLTPPDTRLALQAYEQVLDLILSGRARPGDLINERRVAETLSMSRTPVRDALLMLEGEGLLTRQGKRGLQVKQLRIDDFMDALQIRMLLEPEVTRMAAGKVPDAAWGPLVTRLERLLNEGTAGEADREEVRGVDDRLHGLISDAAGNAQLSAVIRTLRRQTQIFDLKSLPERLEDTCREHLAIIGRLRANDADGAATAMTQHLENVRSSIIRRLTRR
jgi:DNA-binding GntR family transcriptional regulator